MKLKTITTFLYLMVSLPLFLFFKAEIFVWLTFFINYIFITYIAYYHLNREKYFSPFLTSFIVFVLLFFIVAPIIQIGGLESKNMLFPNNYPYKSSKVIFCNILILIFILFFFLGYILFKKKVKFQKKTVNGYAYSLPLAILALFMLCVIIWLLNYNYIINEITKSIYSKEAENISLMLMRKKVLFMIPLGGIALVLRYLKEKKKITTNTLVAFIIIGFLIFNLIFFKNPLTEKRNALGPIYITLIYLFYPRLINTNAKFFLFVFVSMIIFFPLVSALTHVDADLDDILKNPNIIIDDFSEHGGLINAFSTLHYDAYANIMATDEYVSKGGFSFGFQLLSALLFFVPRGLWSSKPLSTGEFIGNFLINDYNFSYNNLSNPLVSEGYINFGLVGVILMAVFLSYFVIKFMIWLQSSNVLKEVIAFYFSVHLIFLLRGDLTNGFAYFIGTYIGVYIIPKLLIRVFKISKT